MNLLQQLGDLFLSAVPTVILLFIFYLVLRSALFLPLLRVMDKRESLIEGSRKESESLASAVQEKQRAYREALLKARADVFASQEAARRSALEERSKVIREARTQAAAQVQAAKALLSAEVDSAQNALAASAEQLAEEVAQVILEPVGGSR